MSRTVLISGATGNQGGAVIRALLKSGTDYRILALTRDANSASAKRLVQSSEKIRLITGDLDHPKQIFEKAREVAPEGVWGAYSVQVAIQNPKEKAQGIALIDAAVDDGVQHFVYSSVDRGGEKSSENPTNIPHFRIKHDIENHLMSKTMSYTILRPVAFFENLTPDFFGKIFATSWSIYLPPEKKLQLVAASDIGAIGGQALMKPEEYQNKAVTIVGDDLTYPEFKSKFEDVTGKTLPTTFSLVARLLNWAMADLGYMFQWFADEGYGGNVQNCAALKGEKMVDFEGWLKNESKFRN